MWDALIDGLAGAGGGIIAQLISYPLQTVVKQEGWTRLYGGLTASLVGTAASQGVYYYFYQIFRSKDEVTALERQNKGLGDGTVGMLSSIVVAALSGFVNVLLTNPIWVVVTRMQARLQEKHVTDGDKNRHYKGMTSFLLHISTLDAIMKMIRYEGFNGFYKGMSTKIVQSVIAAAVLFMIKEEVVNGTRPL